MKPRRVIIGCAAITLLALAVAVIGGFVAVRRLMSPVPLADASLFIDDGTQAMAVLRLQPGEPWLDNFSRSESGGQLGRRDIDRSLPAEAIWSLQTTEDGPAQILSLSLAPRGRLFGTAVDIALWKLGRSARAHVSRVEYADEGITSFPDTPIRGHVFARGNQLVWASSLGAARKAVDLMRSPTGRTPAGAAEALRLPKFDGLLSGAASGREPLLRWGLSLLAGGGSDSTEIGSEPVLEGLTFTLATTSTDTASGEMVLSFAPGVDETTARRAAERAAANLSSAAFWGLTLEAAPRPPTEGSRAILELKVAGLSHAAARLIAAASRLSTQLERADLGGLSAIEID